MHTMDKINRQIQNFAPALVRWQKEKGRNNLPWQAYTTPYERWVSEIMLQQTRVNKVIRYFTRFIQRFPTIESLANAHEDEVLQVWAGLGYYSRARNLHKTAQMIVERGAFPQTAKELSQYPGIGLSTAGAITSSCWQERAVMCDANAKRVLCRYFGREGFLGESRLDKKLWYLARQLLPESTRMSSYNQGLMDLGAMICTKQVPRCQRCPVHQFCQAYLKGTPQQYGNKRPTTKQAERSVHMVFVRMPKGWLFQKKRDAGVWKGLWLPILLQDRTGNLWETLGLRARQMLHHQKDALFAHDFSHYRLWITPHYLLLARNVDWEGWKVIPDVDLDSIGYPAPVKKLLQHYLR